MESNIIENFIAFPKISVIVACLNEEKYIEQCLESLINQDYQGKFDIIVADGGSKDKTIEIVNELSLKFDNIILINNPKKIQAAGRNLAIARSDSDYIAYLDAHRTADKSWLGELWKCYAEMSKADDKIFGVGSVHLDAAETGFSKAQETAFQSIISGATSSNFLNITHIEKVSHACMCLYNKKLFIECGGYDESLPIGEDIELNHRMSYIYGYNLYLNPKAVNNYFPRENFSDLFMQQFRYGYWRQVVINKLDKMLRTNSVKSQESSSQAKAYNTFSMMRLKTMIPAMFVGFLVLLFVLSFFSQPVFMLYYAVIFSYLSVLSISSLIHLIKMKINPTILIIVFVAIHFGYGSGVLSYFLKLKKI
jgi:glycosyltransferase involved in cell wall biosynthesis